MAVRQMQSAETTEGDSHFFDTPGLYHVVITEVKDGENIAGKVHNGFTITCKGLAGNGEDRSIKLTLNDPQETHADQGAFARRTQTAFFIATNQMTPAQLGQPVNVDPERSLHHQMVIGLEFGRDKDDKTKKSKYLQLDGSKVYHIDDPRVKDVAKCADSIGALDPALRHANDADAFFAPCMKKAEHKTQAGSAGSAANKYEGL